MGEPEDSSDKYRQAEPDAGAATAAGPLAVALLTSHNRRDTTLACLDSLAAASTRSRLEIVLVDDGSSDGTAQAVASRWPRARLVRGTGDLYWAAGMALAERTAMDLFPEADILVWINDDDVLDPGSIDRLLNLARQRPDAITAGALRDPTTGDTSYSGVERYSWHAMRFRRVEPGGDVRAVLTFNGNLAAVPVDVAGRLGGIDGAFAHGYADFDYGLRARELGIPVLLGPETFGTCERAKSLGATGSFASRVRFLHSPKGTPIKSQVRFLRRHGGFGWPVLLAGPYFTALKATVQDALGRPER